MRYYIVRMKKGDLVRPVDGMTFDFCSGGFKAPKLAILLGLCDGPFKQWCHVYTLSGKKLRVPWARLEVVSESS